MKRKSKREIVMTDDRLKQERLFRYLMWGQCTYPCRFRTCSDFIAWAADLGFDVDDCRTAWNDLRSIYRQLWGEPVFEEIGQAA
jgi:hypothetical protein